jgi:hypothetical protein
MRDALLLPRAARYARNARSDQHSRARWRAADYRCFFIDIDFDISIR